MPAIVRVPKFDEIQVTISDAGSAKGAPKNSLILYEHQNFEERGRRRIISVTDHSATSIHSLHQIDFKDCLSSLRWNLDEGIVVTLYEDHDGGGRQYQVWGKGQDPTTHDNDFKDCASSWNWYRSS